MELGLTKGVVFPHNICLERGGISPYVLRNVYIIGSSLIISVVPKYVFSYKRQKTAIELLKK